eukprot:Phypoly_transcript_20393.p1 GENE.Phypoly_transcript_20393~~Phypoly_transcript_20393.p1  ORF type:complete len:207 (+),score=22.76 Phypoly_transcript_20393:74-622(+)
MENTRARECATYPSVSASLSQVLLSVACATSVETPALANMTTLASFDPSDSLQARTALLSLSSIEYSHLHAQIWKTYSWDFLNWIIRLFSNKRSGSSFRGKSLLRAALLCLRISGTKIDWTHGSESIPERHKADDVMQWCLSLLGDREAAVRGLACGVLSCVAAHPRTPSVCIHTKRVRFFF